jgi:hypothetical protein
MAHFRTLALLSAIPFTTALAQGAPPVHIRGTIEKLEGNVLSVKTRDGRPVTIRLADDIVVGGLVGASLADIAPGKFIGTATQGEKAGALVALEVLIFPESMRGFNEGHYPWDVKPGSRMTNASVSGLSGVTAKAQDRVLTLKYKEGDKKVYVPEGVPIVMLVSAERSALAPGAHVFIGAARAQPDGSFTTARLNVGLNGLVPPM